MTTNFETFKSGVYNDTFDRNKKFYQVLFKPATAVQSRELNEMQSLLQNQIAEFGSHVFKEGATVSGGEIGIDFPTFIKLKPETGIDLKTYISKQLNVSDTTANVGNSNSKFTIQQVSDKADSDGFYDVYGILDTAPNLEKLKLFDTADSNKEISTIKATTSDATKPQVDTATRVNLEKGTFFINGRFMIALKQSIIVSQTSKTPSAKIGFNVVEKVITSTDDTSLNDPASGVLNSGGKGADRLSITLSLHSVGYTETPPPSFVEMVKVLDGAIEKKLTKTVYSEIATELQRRTFEESGNYVADGFGGIVERKPTGDGYDVKVGIGNAYVKGAELDNTSQKSFENTTALVTQTIPADTVTVPGLYGKYVTFKGGEGKLNTGAKLEFLASDGSTVIADADVYDTRASSFDTDAITFMIRNVDVKSGKQLKDAVKIAKAGLSSSSKPDIIKGLSELYASDNFIFSRNTEDTQGTFFETMVTSSVIKVKTHHMATITSSGSSSTTVTYNVTNNLSGTNLSGLNVQVDENANAWTAKVLTAQGIKTVSFSSRTNNTIDVTFSGINSGTFIVPIPVMVVADTTARKNALFSKKTKTTATAEFTSNSSTPVTITGKRDGIRIVKAWKGTNENQNIVTDKVKMDDGQSDSAFGEIKITVDGVTGIGNTNANKVTVRYEHYTHNESGLFFGPDTTHYPGESIHNFTNTDGKTFNLRESVDFRTSTTPKITPSLSIETGSVLKLPRKDTVVLDNKGQVTIKTGTAGLSPVAPTITNNEMGLYELTIPANRGVPISLKSIFVTRYTMEDINNLDKKLSNLEKVVKLSNLEREATELLLTSATGTARFKNGFFVDDFSNADKIDLNRSKINIGGDDAIKEKNSLLPNIVNNNPIEKFSVKGALGSVFTNTNGVISLKYDASKLVNFIPEIPVSTTVYVNPFQAEGWQGNLTLNPANDVWVGTFTQAPVSRSVGVGLQSTTRTRTVTQSVNVPHIRGRSISVTVSGLRPHYKLKAFFDNEDVTSLCSGLTSGDLVSDKDGKLTTTFTIPNNRFASQTKMFSVVDKVAVSGGTFDITKARTFAQQQYIVDYSGAVNRFTETTTFYFDPLAQSFNIPNASPYDSGIVVKDIELFLDIPEGAPKTYDMTVQIRPMVNGYPSASKIVTGAIKTVSGADLKFTTDASQSTKFEFDKPVHLEPGEYSVVVLSQSNDYKAFVSEIGGTDIKTGRIISDQPYLGSLFKSQNARTWTADQNMDLKFKLNICKFVYPANATNTVVIENADALNTDYRYAQIVSDVKENSKNKISQQFNPVSGKSIANTIGDYVEMDKIYNTNNLELSLVFNTTTGGESFFSPMIDVDGLAVKSYNNDISKVTTSTVRNAKSYYVSKPTILRQNFDSSAIYVTFDMYRPIGTDAFVYVNVGDISKDEWTLVPMDSVYENVYSREDGKGGERELIKLSYQLSNINPKFKSFATQIYLSADPQKGIPFIKNLKVIALED